MDSIHQTMRRDFLERLQTRRYKIRPNVIDTDGDGQVCPQCLGQAAGWCRYCAERQKRCGG